MPILFNEMISNLSTKYIYATCEPYNRYKHCRDESIKLSQEYHYVIETHNNFVELVVGCHHLKNRSQRHARIFGNELAAKIHLIQPVYIESGDLVAILKTMWISILQRTWRRIYYERKRKITKYLRLQNLLKREIGG